MPNPTPIIYSGQTNSTTPFVLTPPPSGTVRQITKVVVSYKFTISPATEIETALRIGSSSKVGITKVNKSSQFVNVYFDNLSMTQTYTSSNITVTTTLPVSITEIGYVTVYCVEYDLVDDADFIPRVNENLMLAGGIWTISPPSSGYKHIVKQISITNNMPSECLYLVRSNASIASQVADYYALTIPAQGTALVTNANIVVDSTLPTRLEIHPNGPFDYVVVVYYDEILL